METNTLSQHPTEALLEQYAAGKLPQRTASLVSTHLFECESCYDRYEAEVDFRIALRNAAPAVAAEPEKVPFWSRFTVWIPNPALVAAAAMALLLMFAVPMWNRKQSASPVFAELSAMRGT